MIQFTGGLTADATVKTIEDERQVVNFSVAINDYYKPKDAEEGKQLTTFINCAYWINTKIAGVLKKGAVVEIAGRLFTEAYLSGNEPKASLNCHVNHIKIHSGKSTSVKENETEKVNNTSQTDNAEPADNLPF